MADNNKSQTDGRAQLVSAKGRYSGVILALPTFTTGVTTILVSRVISPLLPPSHQCTHPPTPCFCVHVALNVLFVSLRLVALISLSLSSTTTTALYRKQLSLLAEGKVFEGGKKKMGRG